MRVRDRIDHPRLEDKLTSKLACARFRVGNVWDGFTRILGGTLFFAPAPKRSVIIA